MPRPSKHAIDPSTLPDMAGLEAFERAADKEAAKWNEVSKETRLDYEAKAERLAAPGGYAFHAVAPATRKAYKAAGLWVMRRRLRKLLKDAKRLRKNGETGNELFGVRVAMWAVKLEEARQLIDHIDALAAVDCLEAGDVHAQASHKQKAATDADLEKFHAWAAVNSSFAEALVVTEFTGCRGVELAKGIRIEVLKVEGVPTLRFHIESAKCDGKKKGLELRCHEVPFPENAANSVKRRWLALAEKATKAKGCYVAVVEAEGASTAGRRITEACRTISEGSGVKVGAYSLRNRFSSQVKASNKGKPDAAINVALALGHQTTKTQRHYARAHRGGGGISPVAIKGVNVMGVQIRGPAQRSGPPLHVRQKVALGGVVMPVAAPPMTRSLRRL